MLIGILILLYWVIVSLEIPLNTFGRNIKNPSLILDQYNSGGDIGKVQIRQLCQQHTRNVTIELKKSLEMLENELTECQNLAESTGENHHLDVFF